MACLRKLSSVKPSLDIISLQCRTAYIEHKKFVPKSARPSDTQVERLQKFVDDHRKIITITGAGLSTESGIPDYRSEEVGLYARKNYKPMLYQDFVKSNKLRQRYWARSYVGWPGYTKIEPCANHNILAKWEKGGRLHWLITQNVDHLHCRAGSTKITELHGTLYETHCLTCKDHLPREEFQGQIEKLNPAWAVERFEIATDGDVFLTEEQIKDFKVPVCRSCGGNMMMPKIVFFGDNVSKSKVDFLRSKVDECDAVLVLGSSLQVFSGYRFILLAAEQQKPICIVNIGETRGDNHATIKLNVKCGDILPLININSV